MHKMKSKIYRPSNEWNPVMLPVTGIAAQIQQRTRQMTNLFIVPRDFFYVWNITKVLGRLRKVVCYYTKERLTLNRIFCFYSRSVTQSAITSASRRYDVVIQLLVEVARSRGQGVPNGSRDPSRRRQAGRRADVSYSAHMDSGRTMWCGPRWPVTIGQSNLLEMPLINTRHALLLLSSPPTHCRSPYRPMS